MALKFSCADARFPLPSFDQRVSPVRLLASQDVDLGLFTRNSQVFPEILAASLAACTKHEATTS
jgi:hypothetical protein